MTDRLFLFLLIAIGVASLIYTFPRGDDVCVKPTGMPATWFGRC